jgi:hypothetical protein
MCQVVILTLFFASAAAAHAQNWSPYYTSTSCLAAQMEHSAEALASNQRSAQRTLESYVRSAGSSESADVSDVFARRGRWRWGGRQGDISAVSDTVARAIQNNEATLQASDQFVLAYDRMTAVGNWIVRSSENGELLGHYRVVFNARGRGLKIAQFDYFFPDYDNPTIEPYCSAPGDIAAYRLEMQARRNRQ